MADELKLDGQSPGSSNIGVHAGSPILLDTAKVEITFNNSWDHSEEGDEMMEGQAQRESQVATQLDALGKKIDHLDDCIGKLKECLSLILRDESNVKSAEEPQQALVPLANRIRGYVGRTDSLIEALQDIMARLEL